MTYNTDGNLAALNQYQRQQDALAAGEETLEAMRRELADKLVEGYVEGIENVVDEFADAFTNERVVANLTARMQAAMKKEFAIPVMGRGRESYDTYLGFLDLIAGDISKRYSTPDEFDAAYRYFGV